MKKTLLALATVASLGAVGASAGAYPDMPKPAPVIIANSGWYVSAFGGVGITPDIDADDDDDSLFNARLEFDNPGYNVGAAIGYRFDNQFRTEVQYTFMSTDLDELRFKDIDVNVKLDGSIRVNAVMGNVYYDFNQIAMNLSPYIGAGLGWANLRTHDAGVVGIDLDGDDVVDVTVSTNSGHDSENDFAIQAMAGLTYAMEGGFDVGVGYRYFRAFAHESDAGDFQNHLINLTLTYNIPA